MTERQKIQRRAGVGHERLEGRTAVVTGAASGIGAALASELAALGMAVAVADIDGDAGERLAEKLRAQGGRALAVTTDVTDAPAVRALAERCDGELGPVSLLCSNAGALAFGSLEEINLADWRWLAAVNVEGLLNCLDAFLPSLTAQTGWRHILVTSSSHGFIDGGGTTALYSATKHAVVSLTESLRVELTPHAVGVTALCPGATSSRILDSQRNRPEAFGPPAAEPYGTGPIPGAVAPSQVARRAIDGILADAPYVFVPEDPTHFRSQVGTRWRMIDSYIGASAAAARPAAQETGQ